MTEQDDFEEYVDERAAPVPSSQRLLIIILSVGCLALAVSNVFLATRVTQLRRELVAERPAPAPAPAAALTPAPPPERAAVAAVGADPPAAAPNRPIAPALPSERPATVPDRTATRQDATAAPPTPVASIASSPPARVASQPVPPAPRIIASTPEVPAVDLPPRAGQREQTRVAAATRTPDRTAAVPTSRESATAVWMVQEYGRAGAESRARSAAEFYGAHSADGAYWRRVLAEITASPR